MQGNCKEVENAFILAYEYDFLNICLSARRFTMCQSPCLKLILFSIFAGNTVEENARLSGVSEPGLYTISKDGALFSWTYQHNVQPFLRPPKRQKLEEDGEDGLNGISSDSADKSSGSRKKYGEDKVVEEEIEDDAKRSESYDIRGSKFSGIEAHTRISAQFSSNFKPSQLSTWSFVFRASQM